MKGKYQVVVSNNRVQYKFEIKRNITILKGDSATGKTTLIDMISSYEENGIDSGIEIQSEVNCRTLAGQHWKTKLQTIESSIVFIDEGNSFLNTKEFASAIKDTDNYYVIAVRNPLPMIPYSVDEIYGIVNKTKGYGNMKRLYSEFKRLYHEDFPLENITNVIVEDSNAGFEFFSEYFIKRGIKCISANGKSNICKTLMDMDSEAYVLIIADGAAFGPEMEKVLKMKYAKHICLFLPESFEWMVLNSGLIRCEKDLLINTEDYIESKHFFSWERFFTSYLTEETRESYLEYTKKKLNTNYLNDKEYNMITEQFPF